MKNMDGCGEECSQGVQEWCPLPDDKPKGARSEEEG